MNSISFEGNFAKQGGYSIYGGALHICRVAMQVGDSNLLCGEVGTFNTYMYVSGLEAVAALMNMTMEQMRESPHGIASDPFKVCICDNMKPDCSQNVVTQPIYPGETVFFPVVAVGQANGSYSSWSSPCTDHRIRASVDKWTSEHTVGQHDMYCLEIHSYVTWNWFG